MDKEIIIKSGQIGIIRLDDVIFGAAIVIFAIIILLIVSLIIFRLRETYVYKKKMDWEELILLLIYLSIVLIFVYREYLIIYLFLSAAWTGIYLGGLRIKSK